MMKEKQKCNIAVSLPGMGRDDEVLCFFCWFFQRRSRPVSPLAWLIHCHVIVGEMEVLKFFSVISKFLFPCKVTETSFALKGAVHRTSVQDLVASSSEFAD